MAASAPSPLASSEEKTNGGKLSRLLIDSLSIRPSYGVRGEEILDGGGGRGRRERKA